MLAISLGIGAAGYHWFAGLSWLDATLNASMILTGMGPVNPLTEPSAKVFAIFYSLFSGVAFLTAAAVIFGPVVYRFLHRSTSSSTAIRQRLQIIRMRATRSSRTGRRRRTSPAR